MIIDLHMVDPGVFFRPVVFINEKSNKIFVTLHGNGW